jgi:hypothetical protein
MPKVTYTASKGLIQEAGSGVSLANLPFSPVQSQNTVSASISQPGVYTMSGTAFVTTFLPAVASVPGGHFTFRSLSAGHAHAISASSEDAGNSVIRLSNAAFRGSNLALNTLVGSSVSLVSDGVQYVVYANTGSLILAGV